MPVIQAELNQPGGNYRRGDLTEGRRRSDVYAGRKTKDRMVPHIEHIHAETKLMALPDVDVFDK